MSRQSTTVKPIKSMTMLFTLILIIAGCGGGSDLATEVSGKYRIEPGNGEVAISLSTDASTLTIDGRTYTGAVEKVDKGTNTVHVKVAAEGGEAEIWSLHQVWNDNGSTFKLKLRRNGTTETLIPVGRS